MGLIDLHYEEGQTPLDEDEKDGLLLPSVLTKGDLDEVEQRNIEAAMLWVLQRRRRFTAAEVFSEGFVKELHRRMFGGVWQWAGSFRQTNKNIGVDKHQISLQLRMLLDDCRYWIEHETFGPDEIAMRCKHRVVAIHCFANGNGRHSRLLADVIIEKLFGKEVFTWSGQNLNAAGTARSTYLTAIRAADRGQYDLLLDFARS